MIELKELVEDFFEYTKEISITECELYDNYYDMIDKEYTNMYENHGRLNAEIERRIKADILYDFIYDIDRIKNQIINDLDIYGKDTQEYKEILKIYNKIKTVFKDFKINI